MGSGSLSSERGSWEPHMALLPGLLSPQWTQVPPGPGPLGGAYPSDTKMAQFRGQCGGPTRRSALPAVTAWGACSSRHPRALHLLLRLTWPSTHGEMEAGEQLATKCLQHQGVSPRPGSEPLSVCIWGWQRGPSAPPLPGLQPLGPLWCNRQLPGPGSAGCWGGSLGLLLGPAIWETCWVEEGWPRQGTMRWK